ncbi:hypothetical protein THAOC_05848, partial [Thalassiosira oceanica]
FKFPEDISSQLVLWANPNGKITNSDLELAGILGHNMVLAQLRDLSELTTATGTDNLPALSCSTKRAVSSTGPDSYSRTCSVFSRCTSAYTDTSCEASTSRGWLTRWWMTARVYGISLILTFLPILMSHIHRASHGKFATWSRSPPRLCCPAALSCSRQPLPAAPEFANMNTSTTSVPPSTSAQQTSLPTTATSLSSPPAPSSTVSTGVANWLLEVPPSSHALRKTLFDSLAKRSKCWASETHGLTQTPAAWTRGGPASGKTGNTMTTRRSGCIRGASRVPDQKNHNRGEKVGQYDSGHASASATKAIAEQVIHLRNNGASNDAPLCSYMHNDQWYLVTPPMLTNLLRQAASRVGHKYGIAPADISARSMRASGAMALLCALRQCRPNHNQASWTMAI